MATFGEWFKQRRIFCGFRRQVDLERAADVSTRTISEIERGGDFDKITPKNRRLLADQLRLRTTELEAIAAGKLKDAPVRDTTSPDWLDVSGIPRGDMEFLQKLAADEGVQPVDWFGGFLVWLRRQDPGAMAIFGRQIAAEVKRSLATHGKAFGGGRGESNPPHTESAQDDPASGRESPQREPQHKK